MPVSTPKVTTHGGIFILEWAREKLKMHISRIHEERGSLYGEFLASRLTSPEQPLSNTRINMLSATGRNALVRELTDRDETLEWLTIVQQACAIVTTRYREGEPVVPLKNLKPRNTPKYRLYPYILEGEISCLFGFGGSAKSYMATLIGTLIHCGTAVLGFEPIQGNTLYLDWETSQQTVYERANAIKQGMGIESLELPLYRRCTRELAQETTEIQRMILENGVKFLIVDSVGMASGMGEAWHECAIRLLRAVRSFSISTLLIDHKPKKGETIFGSVYKINEVRSAFEILASQLPGDSFMDVLIKHAKVNDAPYTKPRSYHIRFDPKSEPAQWVKLEPQDMLKVAQFVESAPLRDRIQSLLRHGKMTIKDIAEELGKPEGQVRARLNEGKGTLFIPIGLGEWGLLADEPD